MENVKGFCGIDLEEPNIIFIGNFEERDYGKIIGLVDYKNINEIADNDAGYVVGLKKGDELKLIKFGIGDSLEKIVFFCLKENGEGYDGFFRKSKKSDRKFAEEIEIKEKIKNVFGKNKILGLESINMEILDEIPYEKICKYIKKFDRKDGKKYGIYIQIREPFKFVEKFYNSKNEIFQKEKLPEDPMRPDDSFTAYRGLV